MHTTFWHIGYWIFSLLKVSIWSLGISACLWHQFHSIILQKTIIRKYFVRFRLDNRKCRRGLDNTLTDDVVGSEDDFTISKNQWNYKSKSTKSSTAHESSEWLIFLPHPKFAFCTKFILQPYFRENRSKVPVYNNY